MVKFWTNTSETTFTPHICHLDHLYIGGAKSVMWRNFRFQCMTDVEKFEISPHAEEFQLFPHNRCGKMWNFAKFGGILHISTWQMWRNPKFTLFCCCKICFVTNYAVFAKSVLARFTSQKLDRLRKNDKYEVFLGLQGKQSEKNVWDYLGIFPKWRTPPPVGNPLLKKIVFICILGP